MTSETGGGSSRGRRLSRSADFDRVFREGRSEGNRFMVVYAFRRGDDERGAEPRLGVSVGRKVGGAVERNQVKRALREAFSECSGEVARDHDYVVVARPEAAQLTGREGSRGVAEALRELLVKATDGGEDG